MQSWTTFGTVQGDPFAAWQRYLSEAFVRLDPVRQRDEPFVGHICKADLSGIEISRVEASAHMVSRKRSHIGSHHPNIAFVNLQVSGIGHTLQAGREVVTRPYDIAIADTSRPYEISHRDRFTLYSIAIARQKIPRQVLEAGTLRLSGLDSGRQLCSMIGNYARLSLRDDTTPEMRLVAGRHILDLLRLAAAQIHLCEPGKAAAVSQAALLDYLRANFTDPALSAETLGRVFGVTSRHVHKLIASTGLTVSDHLKTFRMRAAAAALASQPRRAIIGIASDCGFLDCSHFNRSFKQAFGETPSDYRRRVNDC
jgi:AraC-like DNA-binding protein